MLWIRKPCLAPVLRVELPVVGYLSRRLAALSVSDVVKARLPEYGWYCHQPVFAGKSESRRDAGVGGKGRP